VAIIYFWERKGWIVDNSKQTFAAIIDQLDDLAEDGREVDFGLSCVIRAAAEYGRAEQDRLSAESLVSGVRKAAPA
jgi:purine nucleoside permease